MVLKMDYKKKNYLKIKNGRFSQKKKKIKNHF